jgi:hypothetical protein
VDAAVIAARRWPGALGLAALMIGLIAALAATGRPLGGRILQRFAPQGIVPANPSDIRGVEIRLGKDRIGLHRTPGGSWAFDGETRAAVPGDVAAHLDMALRFLNVSAPTRRLDPEDYRDALADFGLDPPDCVVSLGAVGGSGATVDFGALNPAQTAQYARLVGTPTLYLLPRHVGAEWRLTADLARRNLPATTSSSAHLLLPVSLDHVWAVEIALGGKLHRFERDASGDWFLHVGQHTHAPNTPGHVADPAKAPIIAAALAAFGETAVEAVEAQHSGDDERARFGLDRPALIVLVYPRDSSTPLARIEIGAAAADGLSRYARVAQVDNVVTVAPDGPRRLSELLQRVGAAP